MFFDELLLVLRNPFVIDKFTARSHSKNLLKSSHSRSRTNTTFRFLCKQIFVLRHCWSSTQANQETEVLNSQYPVRPTAFSEEEK
ncbi:uncharacterized protein OCT59_027394 [Rhizophagus irregularis]|uniref:uncharacterized protein n=1 Tax=Rhizophagus irregularis TaxID=588596 RepID=UPI003320136D|nr:hypothetical protein OCT59_027394 [Rhizophagus irregularis]